MLFDFISWFWVSNHRLCVLQGGSMNILIVDDSKLNTKIARDTLLEYKLADEISSCLSGEEALEILEHQSVDLILLDIIMPGLTGIDLLKILVERDLLNYSKVIMLTTIDDLQILKECFELGAVDYLHKPYNKIEFAVRVKSVLSEIEWRKNLIQNNDQLILQNKLLIQENNQLKNINQILREKQLSDA